MRICGMGVALAVVLAACSGDDDTATGGSGGTATASSGGGGSGGQTSAGGGGIGAAGGTGGGAAGGGGGAPSSGCGNAAAPTGVMNESIDVGGTSRTYVLSVPVGYDPNTPLALVFAWHGLGGSGSLARLYFGVEQGAAGGAIFVYADGLVVPQGGTGWDLDVNGDDVLLFDALLAHIEQTYCVDANRVFSTGHSFGGYFSNTLGCARADVLRAIAPVAGGGPFALSCTGPLSAWLAHGQNDPTVDITQGEASRDHWLGEDGCSTSTSPVDPPPCEAYAGCQNGTAVTWCAHTGGHEWPDFAAGGIWGFFASLP